MRIGEIARRTGLHPSAIRFYEKTGILPPALRKSGQRSFSEETELYLGLIGFARQAGFSIAEIRNPVPGVPRRNTGLGTMAAPRSQETPRTRPHGG